jgi:hypothetical protein
MIKHVVDDKNLAWTITHGFSSRADRLPRVLGVGSISGWLENV